MRRSFWTHRQGEGWSMAMVAANGSDGRARVWRGREQRREKRSGESERVGGAAWRRMEASRPSAASRSWRGVGPACSEHALVLLSREEDDRGEKLGWAGFGQ